MKIFNLSPFQSFNMKNLVTMLFFSFFVFITIEAQDCPVLEPEGIYNPKDDILITSYHQSIAKTEIGYITWGEDMASNGIDDPIMQLIDSSNGYNYTGTIVQYAVSGNTGGQAFLLTTTGLYAWGTVGEVVTGPFVSGTAFSSMALPGGVSATDVLDLYATSNAFVITTNSGEVWVASNQSRISGNTSTNTAIWQQVQTSSGVPLTDVFHVTGSDVALYAQQNDGDIFVWGNSVYLGDGNGASNYNYATQMTAPASTPIYISSYFNDTDTQHGVLALGLDGKIYGVGHNTVNKLINEATGAVLNWQTIKYSGGTEMTNVLQISSNHTSEQYSSAAAIVDGATPSDPNSLYTWGSDDNGNIGHGDTGIIEYPTVPGGYTLGSDDAIYVSVGGHATTIYNKSTKTICFTGHVTNNSTGGLTGATSSTFTCVTVVNFDLCGVNACIVDGVSLSNMSSCNNNGTTGTPADDYFTADVTVTFSGEPATGTLDLSGDGTASVAVGSLGVGTYTFVGVNMSADGGIIDLSATFSDQNSCTFNNPNTGTAPNSCSISDADLVTTKVVDDNAPDEGGTIVYTIVVTNNGAAQATNVSLTDNLPTGVSYVSDDGAGAYVSGTGLWTIGTLNNGASATLNITATVDAGTSNDTITNTTTAADGDQDDPTTVGDDLEESITVNNDADLVTTKVVDNGTPNEGDTIVYTITVTNNGAAQATNVSLTDNLPSGVSYVSDVASQGTYDDGTGVWAIGTINNGNSETLQITTTVDLLTAGSFILNSITAANGDQEDSTTIGDDLEEEIEVIPSCDEIMNGTFDVCELLAGDPTNPIGEEDCDGDGVTNLSECENGTDPTDLCDYILEYQTLITSDVWNETDCDGDGVINGQEIEDGTDPTDPCDFVLESQTEDPSQEWWDLDCDGDGVSNGQELEDGTDPLDPCDYNFESQEIDYDNQEVLGVSDEWLDLDCDGDGILNGDEISDNNGNGIPDYDEINNNDPDAEDELEVFDIMTPNGDGLNDVLVIRGIHKYPVNSLEIYNRWGVKVFGIDGYGVNNNFFRGISEGRTTISKGEKLPVGTYYYILIYVNDEGITKKQAGPFYINLK